MTRLVVVTEANARALADEETGRQLRAGFASKLEAPTAYVSEADFTEEQRAGVIEVALRMLLSEFQRVNQSSLEDEDLVPTYDRLAQAASQAARAVDATCHCADFGPRCVCSPWSVGVR